MVTLPQPRSVANRVASSTGLDGVQEDIPDDYGAYGTDRVGRELVVVDQVADQDATVKELAAGEQPPGLLVSRAGVLLADPAAVTVHGLLAVHERQWPATHPHGVLAQEVFELAGATASWSRAGLAGWQRRSGRTSGSGRTPTRGSWRPPLLCFRPERSLG